MYKLIKELFQLLTPKQRKHFYILQVLVILMALFEILAVTSIAPFMAIVGDMSILDQDTVIAHIYKLSGIASHSQFVFLVGVAVLGVLLLSAFISTLTTWRLAMFATKVGSEISNRLYSYYLKQNWLFHTSISSAQLTKKIANESSRVTSLVLQPLMIVNAKIVLVIFMSTAIFFYNPKVAVTGLVVFIISYIILYKLIRKVLQRNGEAISNVLESRYRLMNEGFGGIKDILLLGCADNFIKRFEDSSEILAKSQGSNIVLAQVPRYFMEFIAFGSMIALVLYLIAVHEGNLGIILPVLSVYALAGFKLLPAFQQIYSNVANIKGNISAFESIRQDLIESRRKTLNERGDKGEEIDTISSRDKITLANIDFTYPGKSKPAINALNMIIKANSIIGIVGASGSGKSTLIDILLGLIKPQRGVLRVDNEKIDEDCLKQWQKSIGFVPQTIFLSEGSIAQNIAFGVPQKEIDYDKVARSIRLAHLSEFVQLLEEGLDTKVGERGVQLSGGQRQRIGIARALYNEADILVFDEATSALDGITEKMIMEAIHDFSGKKTIILIAHRLKTVEKCDHIFFMEDGKIVDEGTYEQLFATNEKFQKMTAYA